MDIDAVFLPVAEELIDSVFPTPIKYLQTSNPAYDPATGQTTPNVTEYSINAGILSSGRNEQGGVAEDYETEAMDPPRRSWVASAAADSQIGCFTARTFIGRCSRSTRRISSDDLIASKILVRAE